MSSATSSAASSAAYSTPVLAFKYLDYLFRADNGKGHGIHSPFVYDFVTRVLKDKTAFPGYVSIETLRNRLLDDRREVRVEDFGAGSNTGAGNARSIRSIASSALKPKKFGQLLHRMVKTYEPGNVLELGTSLGVTTCYLASGAPQTRVITMEGSPAIAETARNSFDQLGLKKIEVIEGNFNRTLPAFLATEPKLDFVFLDGNHRFEPTLDYVEMIMPHLNSESCLILDDIHWSREMEQAWSAVLKRPGVFVSIDLFFIGILFFRPTFRTSQHFTIRF